MKNLQQTQTINQALGKEKERLLSELAKINAYIQKRVESLNRILGYQKEYSESNSLILTRMTPALHKNLNSFNKTLIEIIQKEQLEIEKLNNHKYAKIQEVQKVEQKVKVMEHFISNIHAETELKEARQEQMSLDDLSSIKKSRGDYE